MKYEEYTDEELLKIPNAKQDSGIIAVSDGKIQAARTVEDPNAFFVRW